MLGSGGRAGVDQEVGDASTLIIPPEQEPLFPPLPPTSGRAVQRRRWPYLLVAALLIVASGIGAAFLLLSRGTDLAAFEQGLGEAESIAVGLQSETDRLASSTDLATYRATLSRDESAIVAPTDAAIDVPQAAPRAALVVLLASEHRYLVELERLAALNSKTVLAGQFARSTELAVAVEEAYRATRALLPASYRGAATIDLSPAAFQRVLSERRAARIGYEEKLAQVRRENRVRANQLASLRAFTGRLDGVISRYSDSRNELADWIEGVNRSGASFEEAYQVLAQQAERRRQLRGELAALVPPASFAGHVSELLAVIDQAIDATGAAARGIGEYQSDYYGYSRYDETPGWVSFEQASTDISRSFGAALTRYEAAKRTLTGRLASKEPLPKPPAG